MGKTIGISDLVYFLFSFKKYTLEVKTVKARKTDSCKSTMILNQTLIIYNSTQARNHPFQKNFNAQKSLQAILYLMGT